ncbi:MAG: TonB-dependent receptor, partial [Bacteroidales bacterium]|nr:TonB-dependent receptor [Candidatus Colimorpha onthohippi]
YIEITADYYYNRVNNRILTIPTYDFNLWKMFTFDVVDIYGIDISANATIQIGHFEFLIGGKYSYQDATDFSDPASATYGHQIPYTPHHSASANVMIKNKWINVGWDVSVVGSRYYLPYNNWNSSMPGYVDHGLALSKKIRGRTGNILLSAHLLNLFNVQYESVRGFPMTGRSIRIAVNYEYIKY